MTVAEPMVSLEGRVVDQRGEPLPAAEVLVSGARAPEVVLRRVRADGDGAFRAVVARHEWHRLEVHRQGYAQRRVRADGSGWTEVRLQEAAAVKVVVVDANGGPVPNTEVVAQPVDLLGDAWCRGTTDAAGVALLPDVALAKVRFLAWIPGFGLAAATKPVRGPCDVRIAAKGTRPAMLRVRVVAKDEAPLDGVEPVLVGDEQGDPLQLPATMTWRRDDTGRFTIGDLAPMRYRLTLRAPGRAVWPPQHEFSDPQGEIELAFQVGSWRAQPCMATVQDTEGRPVAGVRLLLRDDDRTQRGDGVSDAKGVVHFVTDLRSGENYLVEVDDLHWVTTNVQSNWTPFGVNSETRPSLRGRLDANVAIDVRVKQAGTLRGRVFDATGVPAPYALVALEIALPFGGSPCYAPQSKARAGADGTFEFAGLDPACSKVRVKARLGRDVGTSEQVPVPQPDAADDGAVVVRLGPAPSVLGVVRGADGAPVAGVHLRLNDTSAGARAPMPCLAEALTDHLGRYRFQGLTAMSVMVHVPEPDGAATVTHASLELRNGTNELDLTLPGR